MMKVLLAFFATVVAAGPLRPESRPAIHTVKSGYFAGEPVRIAGESFAPFETVGLLVTHAGGGAEAGAGHEWFFVRADAQGSFEAAWSVDREDAAGTEFVVIASGASGSTAQNGFARIARISTDRPAYRPGELVQVVGSPGTELEFAL